MEELHHIHSPEHTKSVVNRLSRAMGHLDSVRKMVENGRDCSEVLVQLAAVRSALNSTAKVILKEHMEHCMTDAIAGGTL
ncbi:MAG: metal-sensing transcriptional repressor, partial [Oscillospiraceae bacterium]|nr:metal-sensing transcriptional repressor [Oscillospiraceae bacterium]